MENNEQKLLVFGHILGGYKNNIFKFDPKQIFRILVWMLSLYKFLLSFKPNLKIGWAISFNSKSLLCLLSVLLTCLPTIAIGTSKDQEEIKKAELLYDSEQAYRKFVLQGQINEKRKYLVQEIFDEDDISLEPTTLPQELPKLDALNNLQQITEVSENILKVKKGNEKWLLSLNPLPSSDPPSEPQLPSTPGSLGIEGLIFDLSADSTDNYFNKSSSSVNDYNLPRSSSLQPANNGDFSVELLFKPTLFDTAGRIKALHKVEDPNQKGYSIGLNEKELSNNRKLSWRISDGMNTVDVISQSIVGVNIPEDQWVHVVGTWSGSEHTASLYINGVKENTTSNTNISNFSTSALASIDKNFVGKIARIRIYSHKLTDAEVGRVKISLLEDVPKQDGDGLANSSSSCTGNPVYVVNLDFDDLRGFPAGQELVTLNCNGVLNSVNMILRQGLLDNPGMAFFTRLEGGLVPYLIRTPAGFLTQFDFTQRDPNNQVKPLLTMNYFFHISNAAGEFTRVVKIENIYHILPNEKIITDPIMGATDETIGHGIINNPALTFVYEEVNPQLGKSYTESTGEALIFPPDQMSFLKNNNEYAIFDNGQAFDIVTIIREIHKIFKLAMSILNPQDQIVRVPNDIDLPKFRILNTEDSTETQTAYFFGKYLLARDIRKIFDNRIPLNIRKIISILLGQHPDPKPLRDTLVYEIVVDPTNRLVQYFTIENDTGENFEVTPLTLANGFLYYTNNNNVYNEPASQITLSRNIKEVNDQLLPENLNPRIPEIDIKVRLVELLWQREDFLLDQIGPLASTPNLANLTPYQKVYLYLLNRKKENVVKTIEGYRTEIQAYITRETPLANALRNPLHKHIILLRLKKLERAICNTSQCGLFDSEVEALKSEVNKYKEIANRFEAATLGNSIDLSRFGTLLNNYESNIPRLRNIDIPGADFEAIASTVGIAIGGGTGTAIGGGVGTAIVGGSVAGSEVNPSIGADEFYYDLENLNEQLQVKINRLDMIDLGNEPYYTQRVAGQLDNLRQKQVKANQLKASVVAVGIPLIREIIRDLAPAITEENANTLAKKMVRRYGSHAVRRIFAKVQLLNKLKFLQGQNAREINNENLLDKIYGVDFGFTGTPSRMDVTGLINWLGRERTDYTLERKYILLFGNLEEILYKKINTYIQEINREAVAIQREENTNLTNFDNLLSVSQGVYSFWTDAALVFMLCSQIAGNQELALSKITDTSMTIDNSEREIKILTAKITCLDLAGFEYEASLQKFYGRNLESDVIRLNAWIKYKYAIQRIDPQLFNQLSNIVNRRFTVETGLVYAEQLLQMHDSTATNDAHTHGPHGVWNDIHPVRRILGTGVGNPGLEGAHFDNNNPSPGKRFFDFINEKSNEIKRIRPYIALPESIFRDYQYSCGDTRYRPALFAFTYSSEYQEFSDAFISLQKSLKLFSAVSNLANGRDVYRSDQIGRFAIGIKNDVQRKHSAAKTAAQPIISWLGMGYYEGFIGPLGTVVSPEQNIIRPPVMVMSSNPDDDIPGSTTVIPAVTRTLTMGIFPNDFFSGTITITPGTTHDRNTTDGNQRERDYDIYAITRGEENLRTSVRADVSRTDAYAGAENTAHINRIERRIASFLIQPTARLIFSLKSLTDDSSGSLAYSLRNIVFRPTTWWNYWTADFIIQVVAVIVAVAAVVFFIPSGGTSSMLAISVVGALGGLIGAQVAMEVLYIAHIYSGGDPAFAGSQSRIGRWIRDITAYYPGLGTAFETFAEQVAFAYFCDFVQSAALTFATIGIGTRIAAVLGRLGNRLPDIFMRGATIENAALRQTGLETVKCVSKTHSGLRNFIKELFEELTEELGIEPFIGSFLPVLSEEIPGFVVVIAGGLRKKRAGNIQARNGIYEFDSHSRANLRESLTMLGYTITDIAGSNDFNATRQFAPGVTINGNTSTQLTLQQAQPVEPRVAPTDQNALPSVSTTTNQLPGTVERDGAYRIPPGEYKLPNGIIITVSSDTAISSWEFDAALARLERIPQGVQKIIFPHLRITIGETVQAGDPNATANGTYNEATRDIRVFVTSSNLTYIHEIGHLFHNLLNGQNITNADQGTVNTDQALRDLYNRVIGENDASEYSNRFEEYIANLFAVWVEQTISGGEPNFNSINPRMGNQSITLTDEQSIRPMYDHLVGQYFTNNTLINDLVNQATELSKFKNGLQNIFQLEFVSLVTATNVDGTLSTLENIANNLSENVETQAQLRRFVRTLLHIHITQNISGHPGLNIENDVGNVVAHNVNITLSDNVVTYINNNPNIADAIRNLFVGLAPSVTAELTDSQLGFLKNNLASLQGLSSSQVGTLISNLDAILDMPGINPLPLLTFLIENNALADRVTCERFLNLLSDVSPLIPNITTAQLQLLFNNINSTFSNLELVDVVYALNNFTNIADITSFLELKALIPGQPTIQDIFGALQSTNSDAVRSALTETYRTNLTELVRIEIQKFLNLQYQTSDFLANQEFSLIRDSAMAAGLTQYLNQALTLEFQNQADSLITMRNSQSNPLVQRLISRAGPAGVNFTTILQSANLAIRRRNGNTVLEPWKFTKEAAIQHLINLGYNVSGVIDAQTGTREVTLAAGTHVDYISYDTGSATTATFNPNNGTLGHSGTTWKRMEQGANNRWQQALEPGNGTYLAGLDPYLGEVRRAGTGQ